VYDGAQAGFAVATEPGGDPARLLVMVKKTVGRRPLSVLLGVIVALVLWAVADGPGSSVSGPVIAVDWDAYPAGEVSGRLTLVDGCLYLDDAAAFWARGTTWDAARNAVVFERADAVTVGEIFAGGGGHYYARDLLDGLDGLDVDAVMACMRRAGTDEAVVATS
jgi:hypothetical protein